ncbi:MAG: SMC-Scp complex subunit ScpB, partial [Clostridia bacterium]
EGILFLSGTSVSRDEIQEKLGASPIEIENAISEIKAKFSDSGIIFIEVEDRIQFATNQKYVEQISAVLNPIREREFSQSMLETASIIAYKQPITRLEVEKIRGVSSEYAMSALLKQGIIMAVGRKDAVGKPYLFGTTETFLKKFNLKSIEELPNYAELMKKLSELVDEPTDDILPIDDEKLPDFLVGEDIEIVG